MSNGYWLIPLLLAAAGPAPAPAQEPLRWHVELKSGLEEAARSRKPILLLFTVGPCPVCRELDEKVFGDPEYAAGLGRELVHVKLDYTGPNAGSRGFQILAATARLQGYPTLYLLDGAGWPFYVRHGYDGEGPAQITAALRGALANRERPAKLKAEGDEGWRDLLAWYRAQENSFGETLAAAAVFERAPEDERAKLVPLIVGAATAKDGAAGANPQLALVRKVDADGCKGLQAAALGQAGSQFLRRAEFVEGARCFARLLALEGPATKQRAEAEASLGYAYRKLDAPCLAREHYRRCAELAAGLKDDCAEGLAAFARQRLDEIEACDHEPCACVAKRVKPE